MKVCNISKTSASVSLGFPNKRKLSILLFFECLETLMNHEAQVFEIASQSCIINQEQQKKYF